MEDNGDVGGAWTPDFPTRYLPMVQPEQAVRFWHKADNSAAPEFVRFWIKADKAGF